MPLASVNGTEIYYEIHGNGPRLALVEGLGYHRWMWYRQLPAFTPHFTTLIYDNRGVGKSAKPPGPYTHEQNAADLLALLDHVGWERTHVLGVSMGGFIAQQLALSHPDRLAKLVLVATAFGGPRMIPVPPAAAKAMMPDQNITPEDRISKAMPIAFGDPSWPARHGAEFDQIVAWRLEEPQPPEATMAQVMAGASFDVSERIRAITAPTLVIAGSKDGVVPPENSRLLAEEIPGATLEIIPEAGHLLFIEAADDFNDRVIRFLESPSPEAARQC
jgi:pimeloyl-ACP methyl ester carboxylesterase